MQKFTFYNNIHIKILDTTVKVLQLNELQYYSKTEGFVKEKSTLSITISKLFQFTFNLGALRRLIMVCLKASTA